MLFVVAGVQLGAVFIVFLQQINGVFRLLTVPYGLKNLGLGRVAKLGQTAIMIWRYCLPATGDRLSC